MSWAMDDHDAIELCSKFLSASSDDRAITDRSAELSIGVLYRKSVDGALRKGWRGGRDAPRLTV